MITTVPATLLDFAIAARSSGDDDDHWIPAASVSSTLTITAMKEKTLPDLKKETPPEFSILAGSDQQQPGGAIEDSDNKNPSAASLIGTTFFANQLCLLRQHR
ncbi:hypothetical protein ACLOJK_040198 [Asimina triloba]